MGRSAGLSGLSALAAHPAVGAGGLVAVVGFGGGVASFGLRVVAALAPAWGEGVMVGLSGQHGGRVVGVIGGAEERAEGAGEGAG